jgi:hypothetical protein
VYRAVPIFTGTEIALIYRDFEPFNGSTALMA